jgi:hypothetical protein
VAFELVEREDGVIGWLVVHSSLDGREQHEGHAESRSG